MMSFAKMMMSRADGWILPSDFAVLGRPHY
jgi:hypothetical protein